MLRHVHIIALVALVTASRSLFAAPDGSTVDAPIVLKERDPAKAVEEEMQWMMKVHHYTPVLAERDEMAELARKAKAGMQQGSTQERWGHAFLTYNGRSISAWWFFTPTGKREMYFDVGRVRAHKEAVRQESVRGQYMLRMAPPIKVR